MRCRLCGINTLFYVWSTSRPFPTEKLIEQLNITSKEMKRDIRKGGWAVCYKCREKLD